MWALGRPPLVNTRDVRERGGESSVSQGQPLPSGSPRERGFPPQRGPAGLDRLPRPGVSFASTDGSAERAPLGDRLPGRGGHWPPWGASPSSSAESESGPGQSRSRSVAQPLPVLACTAAPLAMDAAARRPLLPLLPLLFFLGECGRGGGRRVLGRRGEGGAPATPEGPSKPNDPPGRSPPAAPPPEEAAARPARLRPGDSRWGGATFPFGAGWRRGGMAGRRG